jgi:hypothetical protein
MNEIPPTTEHEVLETAKYSEKQPQKKPKFRISLKLKIVIAFLLLLAIFLAGFLIKTKFQEYQLNKVRFNAGTGQPTTETPQLAWKEYISDINKFLLLYPSDAVFEEPSKESTDTIVFKITSKGTRQTEPITTDSSLTDGYIFKIILNKDIILKELREISESKIASFKQNCSDLYTSTDPIATQVDTIPAQGFSINNCPSYYDETFVIYNGTLYEIVRIFRGDVGYREKYKQTATQILESFKFLDKPLAPETPKFSTYTNDTYKLSFVHPNLDSKCCDVNGPVYGTPDKIVVLGDSQSYEDNKGKSFNGFGVFIDQNKENRSFTDYMDLQRKTLEENYKVITGKKPEVSEEKIKVGDVEGIILKNYAWWGDMIYVQIPNTTRFMIISKVETSPGVFDKVFAEILKTFRFNIQVN